jgi:ferredoxin
MRYVNRQIYANEAVKWFDQFTHLEPWNRDRQQRLRDLGPEPKPEDVDKIMGACWAAVQCSQCGKHCPSGIEFDVMDAETSDRIVLCGDCIDAAYDLFYDPEVSE